jgi:hypothetical protein
MAWSETLTALNYVLAGLYPFLDDSYRLVDAAGIPRAFVAFQRRAIDNWYQILDEADKRGKVPQLVEAALKDYPDNPVLVQAKKGELSDVTGPVVDKDVRWRGRLTADTAEKLMGQQSTLLPVSFLEVGLRRSRSVARVKLASGELGTGFLTADNVFVTNHHVIADKTQAEGAFAQFNFQQSALGLDLEPTAFPFAPGEGFKTSAEDDWTLVKVAGDANAAWGAIEVAGVDVSKVERVNIIQHPSGGPKQIAIYHNVVAYADDKRVQYLTDTLPGSSGSPVFDDLWRVVALHHSGGWILEPGTKQQVFRNEGININLVAEALAGGLK